MTEIATAIETDFGRRILDLPIPNRHSREPGVLDLSRNELVHPAIGPLIAGLLAELGPDIPVRYPVYSRFIRDLARVACCEPGQLEIFPGSDDAIGVIIDAFARADGSLVLQDPTYPTYRYQAHLRSVPVLPWLPRPGTLVFEPEDVLRTMRQTASSVVVVTDPHGMLGSTLAEEAIEALAATAHEREHLLVIDECYAAFNGATGPRGWQRWDNVLRIGSFSKSAGMAGMRLGYVIGDPSLVDYLRRWRRAGAVSAVTLTVALALCRDHRDELEAIRKEVIDGREWLACQVTGLEKGLVPLPSHANFLTIDAGEPEDARRLKRQLAENEVRVRSHADHPSFSSLIQVTAAPKSVAQQVVIAMKDTDKT